MCETQLSAQKRTFATSSVWASDHSRRPDPEPATSGLPLGHHQTGPVGLVRASSERGTRITTMSLANRSAFPVATEEGAATLNA